jgi:hypothetical protein
MDSSIEPDKDQDTDDMTSRIAPVTDSAASEKSTAPPPPPPLKRRKAYYLQLCEDYRNIREENKMQEVE